MRDLDGVALGHELVLKNHSEQGNPGLDSEADVGFHPGDQHRHRVAFARRERTARANGEGAAQRGALGIWIPGMPGGDILVDAKDPLGRGLDKDAVLDLHGWWRVSGSAVLLTFEMSGSRRRSYLD